jgi:ABC-type Fe3+ transport system substrate-binding protein
MTRSRIAVVALAAVATALLVAGIAGAGRSAHAKVRQNLAVSGTITFDGVWTGAEATAFGKVIASFNKVYPKVHVKYNPLGNNVSTVLATAIAGGHPPDMADIAQPGLVKQYASQGKLKPITYASSVIAENFAPAWRQLGTFNNKLYALVFKAANKSTLWYNVPAFKAAGVKAPKTWAQLTAAANTLKSSGTAPYSICGASGWTLTDLFENIYLRTFGAAKYNALSAHKIKWTDPSVITALKTMGGVIAGANVGGGTSGALQTDFPTCVTNAFASPSKGAIVLEADFVGGVILTSTKAKAGTGFDAVPFPTIAPANSASVEIGGDLFVTFRDTPAIEAFVKYLATAPAAEVWAKIGGFGTGNKNVPASIYPDAITRVTEAPIGTAKSVVFDMSDEQPASFGSTTGQGEWGLFQNFLQNPNDAAGIAAKLEAAATAAYKAGK